jgi:hypothetical protein
MDVLAAMERKRPVKTEVVEEKPVKVPEGVPYWLPKEFALVVRLHEKSIYRLMKEDPTFPHVRVGGSLRIPRERALRWLASRTQGAR